MTLCRLFLPGVAFLLALPLLADAPPQRTGREALQPFNDLIGTWKGTGDPKGATAKSREFWIETQTWQWHFKGADAYLTVEFAKSPRFSRGELRYLPEKDLFQLTAQSPAKESCTFVGSLKDRVLTVDRDLPDGSAERLVVTLLHANRFLYRLDQRPADKTLFVTQFKVGVTKEGVPFAAGDGKPECIVSGGLGTISVTYQGQTYYVCCGGCRTEFYESPAKYVKEFEEKKRKSAK